jgi:hypothetical protein
MNPYLKIFVEGRRLDLPKDGLNLTVSYSVFDPDDLTPSGSNADRPIEFESTKNNDAAFGSWYNVALNNLQAAELKPASIEVNGIPILLGQSKLIEATTKGFAYGRRGLKYKTAFFGNNGDWIQFISGLKLADLDWTDQNHIFTEDNVVAGLDADPDAIGYGYALAKVKNWGFEDAGGYAATIFDTVSFLFVNTILDAIFIKYLGYTWNSDFFTKQAHKRFILPCFFGEKLGAEYGEDYLDVTAEYTVPTTYLNDVLPYPIDFDNQTSTPPQAPTNPLTVNAVGPVGTFFDGIANTTTYICPCDGYYQISLRVEIGTTVSSPNVQIGIFTDATAGGTLAFTDVSNPATGSFIEYSRILEATAGDYIQPAILSSGGDTELVAGTLKITGEAVLSIGFNVDFKYLLQDWTVGKFLKGLSECFNLKFETNVALQQVVIEPLDSYTYTQRTGIGGVTSIEGGFLSASLDQTNKLDLSKEGVVQAVSDSPRVWRFAYKEDGNDKTVETLQANQEFRLYESNYLLPPERFKEEEKLLENSFFAATLHTFDATIRAENSDFIPQVPLFWAEDYTETQSQQKASQFAPRLLWFGGKRGLDGNFRFYSYDTASVIDTILPACFAVNYNDTSGFDISLSYCNQTINEFNALGLTERFYLRTLARKRAGKIVQEWLHLKNIDILNLSFRNKVLLQGSEFILLSVDSYDPTTNASTKVMLEYNQLDSSEDYTAFVDSPVLGVYGTYIVE